MTELHWKATVGDHTQEGSVPLEPGTLNLRAQFPAGTIWSITAWADWDAEKTEKIFMNGYQTWTYCPEYTVKDRIRDLRHVPGFLMERYRFDRYGDYHFVSYGRKQGMTHGFSYCYFRNAQTFRLLASTNERPGYTLFRYNSKTQQLRLERDCAGVEHPGGELDLFDLFVGQGTEDAVFDGWFAAMQCKCRTCDPIAGYSSWYNRYENITQETVFADLNGCKTVLHPGDLFQVDDGWEPAVGDWLAPDVDKFPGGMKAVADSAHKAGFRAGLWLAPFVCEKDSVLFQEHKDWLLWVNGENWSCGGNWSGFYALDIDNPQVQQYLEQVFHRVLVEWGFDLVKLDFLYGAAPFGTKNESRAGRMIRAMELLRTWCGDKLILGCGVPVMPAFGLVDYCRVSCDVSLDWNDKWFMRLFHRERVSTKQAIGNTVFRRQLNGRAYGSDPDVFFLRKENIHLTQEQKEKLSTVCALFGNVLLTSDDPTRYSVRQRDTYERIRRLWETGQAQVEADDGLSICYSQDGQTKKLKLW